jgi:hypothetical protein
MAGRYGAKIPQYFAQRKMPTGAGVAKMDWPSFHAGRQSQAMAEFSRAFAGTGELAEKRLNSIIQSEYSSGKAAYSTEIKAFQNLMEKDPDSDSYVAKFKKHFDKAEKDILKGKSQAASKILTDFFKNQRPSLEEAVKDFAWRRKEAKCWADDLDSVRAQEILGNTAKAEAILFEAMEANPDRVPEAKARLAEVRSNADWYKGLVMVDRDPSKFIEMAKAEIEGYTEKTGPKFSFLTNLDPAQKMALYEKAKRLISSRAASFKAQREVEINAEQGRLMGLLRRNELTEDEITNSKLDEFGTGSKDTFYRMMDAKAKAIIEEKKTPYTESDPIVEAQTLDRLRDPDEKIVPKDISKLVGKGLSIDDASRIIDNLDVFKDPWFKRVDMYLKSQLGWDGAYEKFVHPEGGIAYKLASDKLFEAIESEKLRGKAVYERGSEIAIPFVVDYWEKALMLEPNKIQNMKAMLIGKLKPPESPPSQAELEKLVGKDAAVMETKAFGVVLDLWDYLPRETQSQIHDGREKKKSYTEIISEGGVSETIDRLLKTKKRQPTKTPTKPTNKDLLDLDPMGIFK